jgi:hypothetical protein
MAKKIAITADQVRSALLQRIDAFLTTHGMSASAFGKEVVRDDRFVNRIRNGGNFTVKTYQQVIDWLDAAEREAA